jgi:N-acetylgalactosamine kinase
LIHYRYKGFHEYAKSKGVNLGSPVGLDVLVDGIVPTGSGLSSSAAFVCSATIAIMAVFGHNFEKKELAQLTCECERHIGTQSGGMDQVIIFSQIIHDLSPSHIIISYLD